MAYDQISISLLGIQQSHIDIFGVAAKIAEGEEIPNDILQEYVSKDDFIREAEVYYLLRIYKKRLIWYFTYIGYIIRR